MGRPRKRQVAGRASAQRAGEPETRTRILDAAERVFADVGFPGARTQAIAEAAGVTKAMIHYYFESKERLYRAVLDRILFELIKLVQEVTSGDAGRVDVLRRFIGEFFDYVARHPQFGRLTLLGSGPEGRYFDNIVSGFFRPLFARAVRFLEEGMAEGAFRRADASQLLLAIYATAMGYLADARFISLVLGEDAMSAARLADRRAALIEMVCATLGVS